jgi:hypothetical protein
MVIPSTLVIREDTIWQLAEFFFLDNKQGIG